MLARAGCGGRISDASRPRAQSLPYQKEKEPAIIVMLSEAKHLFWARLQILRRSAPQNDKLLNCSQTPRQTGICNWRQRREVEGKDVRAAAVCRAKHRRSAVRAEAPPCGGSQNSLRWLRHENNCCTTIETRNRLRLTQYANCKTAKNRQQTTANEQRFSLPTTSLRRQRTAESANHADANHDPHHSGCEVALGEDKTKSAANWQHAPSKTYTRKNAATMK